MSSDSEASDLSDMNESNEVSKDSEDDWGVVDSEILPYQDEPLAAEDEALDVDDSEEERDVDGLTPSTLAEAYGQNITHQLFKVNLTIFTRSSNKADDIEITQKRLLKYYNTKHCKFYCKFKFLLIIILKALCETV